jgi:hypothetical protein
MKISNDSDFDAFWAIYPRKVARKDALKMWTRLTDDEKWLALQALPIHIRYWEAAGREMDRIPHAASWINGERWADELAMPKTRRASDDWMRSKDGIQAKAAEVGITPKPGEDWMSLKARVLAKVSA